MKSSKIFKRILPFLGLVLMYGMLAPSLGQAATFYVSQGGDDTNSGTQIAPFRHIKYGVSRLSPGDTLYVKAGKYRESILSWKTHVPSGTSWERPVVVASFPGDTVTITPPPGHAFFWIKEAKPKYLIIDGFIIDCLNEALHGLKFHGGASHIRVQNTEIKNATASGILVSSTIDVSPDSYHEFINLNLHHNGSTAFDHGFYIETSYNLVENSLLHDNTGYGGHLFSSGKNSANFNIIRNNKFYDNNTYGKWGCGLILSSGKNNVGYSNIAFGNFTGFCIQYRATNNRLYNNISYENDFNGIYVGSNTNVNAKIENNTIFNNGLHGVIVNHGSKDAVVRNNISYQNKSNDIYLVPDDQTGTVVSHNLTGQDPKFVDKSGKNFRLQNGSPAIDNGTTILAIVKDFDGVKRDTGKNYDMGAFEFPQADSDNQAPATPLSVTVF